MDIRVRHSDGSITAMDLETYLQGVVPALVPSEWPAAALQAAAVLARSWTVYKKRCCDTDHGDYDLRAAGADLSWLPGRSPAINAAIKATESLILSYRGRPVLPYWHTASPGHTEDNQKAFWGAHPVPYLAGVAAPDVPDELSDEATLRHFLHSKAVQVPDAGSPQYRWSRTLAAVQAESLLSAAVGTSIGRLLDLQVTRRGVAGTAIELRVTGSTGAYTITGAQTIRQIFRSADGTPLPSAIFVCDLAQDRSGHTTTLTLQGSGQGHAVGMSLWGACGLAKMDLRFDVILAHYFPGITVSHIEHATAFDAPAPPPNIQFIESPNFGYPDHAHGRSGERPLAIVLHIMQGHLDQCDAHFRNPASQVSANFAVGRGGEIHQYVREEDASWANGKVEKPNWFLIDQKPKVNPNLYTISIEHDGYASETDWTPEMIQSDIALIKYLCEKWDIPKDRDHIIGHDRIDSVNRKFCPGNKCPWDKIMEGIGAPPPPPPAAPAKRKVNWYVFDAKGVRKEADGTLDRLSESTSHYGGYAQDVKTKKIVLDLRGLDLRDESSKGWAVFNPDGSQQGTYPKLVDALKAAQSVNGYGVCLIDQKERINFRA